MKRLPLVLLVASVVLAACSPAERERPAESEPPEDRSAAAEESSAPSEAAASTDTTTSTQSSSQEESPMQLVITDVKKGVGPQVQNGQTAVVHYTGWLYSAEAPESKGRKFDSSRDRSEPFRFRVGGGEVIAGWDQGVAGMQPGGQRRLVIPPELGYGQQGAGGVIPPGATLLFDVELVGIE